jgi:glycosyltransferase involved in cell wall biosynthesis
MTVYGSLSTINTNVYQSGSSVISGSNIVNLQVSQMNNLSDVFRVLNANNDTVLLDQTPNQWIETLTQPFLNNDKMGCTGPSKLEGVGYRDFIIFFCAMTKREIWNQVGGLDTIFGVGGGEDIDYCFKIQDIGYKISQVPNNTSLVDEVCFRVGNFPIYHKGESTVFDNPNWNNIYNKNTGILIDKYLPTVLIIVPAYNAEKTIEKTIQSLLDQTYTKKLILLIDDCSTDRTSEAVEIFNYAIKYYRNEINIGVSDSRNYGLDFAKNNEINFIAYCDADDWWDRDHLDNSMRCLIQNNADLVYSNPHCWNTDNVKVYPNWFIPKEFSASHLSKNNYIWISSVVHRLNEYRFDGDVNSLEDWSMWLQFLRHNKVLIDTKIRDVNYLVRENTNASKSKEIFMKFAEKNSDIVPIRMNLGCGDDIIDGWINIDAYSDKAQVKMDIKKFYPSVNHATLKDLLKRKFKDKDLFLVVSNGLNFIILYFIFEYHSSKVKRGNINSLYIARVCSFIMTILLLYIY